LFPYRYRGADARLLADTTAEPAIQIDLVPDAVIELSRVIQHPDLEPIPADKPKRASVATASSPGAGDAADDSPPDSTTLPETTSAAGAEA